MVTLEEILRLNGQEIWSDAPESDMDRMVSQLCKSDVGAVLVLADGVLAGIVSAGVFLRKVILAKKPFNESRLREIITRKLITTSPELIARKCLRLTKENHVCHLPVVFDDRFLGIVSVKELALVIPRDNWL